ASAALVRARRRRSPRAAGPAAGAGFPAGLEQVVVGRTDGQAGAADRGHPRAGCRPVRGRAGTGDAQGLIAEVTGGEVDADAGGGRLDERVVVRLDVAGRQRLTGEAVGV